MAFWNRNKQAMEESGRDVPRGNDGIEQTGRVCNQAGRVCNQVGRVCNQGLYLIRPAALLCLRDQMASATSTSEERVSRMGARP